jgi:hypothetical protein
MYLALVSSNLLPNFVRYTKQGAESSLMKNILLTVGLILGSAIINLIIAQPPPPTPFVLPIDQGLSLILAMGAGYGAKHLYDSYKLRKTNKKTDDSNN